MVNMIDFASWDWSSKNVLVTGYGGFIGNAVAEFLHVLGANVIGATNEPAALLTRHPEIKIVKLDVTDFKTVADLISRYEIDVVYHLAAYSIVRSAAKNPIATYNVNVMGTVNVLEAARVYGKKSIKVITASSDKAYGDHEQLPYEEKFPLLPTNIYDVSKACGDLISQSYRKAYNLDVTVTRCSNVYGPRDCNLSRLIPNTIKRLCAGKMPQVYEDVLQMEREFIFISDVISAYEYLARYTGNISVFNIGKEEPRQIKAVVDLICAKFGVYNGFCDAMIRESAFHEIQKQSISSKLLEHETGWKAEISLEEGLDETVKYYRRMFCE